MNNNTQHLPWSYKYRPQTVDDIIMTDKNREKLKEYIERGAINNLLLAGVQGTGKTTYAKIVINHLMKDSSDYLEIDGSLENGVDVIRDKIKPYCKSNSFSGGLKLIFIDEFDYFSKNAQAGLRKTIEEDSENARFIFTCNFGDNVFDAIRSRCTLIDLAVPLTKPFIYKVIERLLYIMEQEGVSNVDFNGIRKFITKGGGLSKRNKEVVLDLMSLIKDKLPDIRSIIEILDDNTINGKLQRINVSNPHTYIDNIVTHLKSDVDTKTIGRNIHKIIRTEKVNDTGRLINELFKRAEELSSRDFSQIHILLQKMMVEDVNAPNKQLHIMGYMWQLIDVIKGDGNRPY